MSSKGLNPSYEDIVYRTHVDCVFTPPKSLRVPKGHIANCMYCGEKNPSGRSFCSNTHHKLWKKEKRK